MYRAARSCLLVLAMVGLGAVSALAEPVGEFLPTHYALDMEVDYASEMLHATAGVTLENQAQTSAGEVSFLLYRTLRVRSVTDGAGNPLEFSQCVVSFEDYPVWQANQVLVTPGAPVPPGGETTVVLEYEGYLLGYTETGMSYVRDSIDPEFTIIRNDALAYPMPVYPTIGAARRQAVAEFDYTASITVPTELTVVCGGRLEGVEEAGEVHTFSFSSIIPSWRMDFAIADYSEISAGAVRICYLPAHQDGAQRVARAAGDAVELFTEWFGPRPKRSSLTFIMVPDGWGSQTEAATIIQSAAAFQDTARHREVYHEISHLWNVRDTDDPSPRWEEGLATFLEFLVTEELTGEPAVERLENWVIGRLREGLAQDPPWREVPLVDYGRTNLTDTSYRAGALFFDLLYRLEGREAFNGIISEYVSVHGESGGSLRELAAIITRSGRPGVEDLCQDWLFTAEWTKLLVEGVTADDLLGRYTRGPSD